MRTFPSKTSQACNALRLLIAGSSSTVSSVMFNLNTMFISTLDPMTRSNPAIKRKTSFSTFTLHAPIANLENLEPFCQRRFNPFHTVFESLALDWNSPPTERSWFPKAWLVCQRGLLPETWGKPLWRTSSPEAPCVAGGCSCTKTFHQASCCRQGAQVARPRGQWSDLHLQNQETPQFFGCTSRFC